MKFVILVLFKNGKAIMSLDMIVINDVYSLIHRRQHVKPNVYT